MTIDSIWMIAIMLTYLFGVVGLAIWAVRKPST